ncbi:MAG: ribbon-helix-helix protein, CopG family [Rhodospirillaceae bacterium]|nr:ribbon-helix-helix protein, CopG family [Rhodospirillaceae bacterium]
MTVKQNQLVTHVDKKTVQRFDVAARREGHSRSAMLRKIVTDWLSARSVERHRQPRARNQK